LALYISYYYDLLVAGRASVFVPKRADAMDDYFDRRAVTNAIKRKADPEWSLVNNGHFEIRNYINIQSSELEIGHAVSAESRFIGGEDEDDRTHRRDDLGIKS